MPIAYARTFLNPSNSSILRLATGPPDADRDCILRATCYVLRATCYVLRAICNILRGRCYVLYSTREENKREKEREKVPPFIPRSTAPFKYDF